ncbi:hypothetical protein BCO18430_03298 [Burkholderia contaminans]|uniref:hypothetical protein n=1 Tax=Burkholderia contaminans TaxID=488447 RepID=UPI0014534729|nr:hypothetical protein [Burkholderia contaminans]VWC91766.1 hypothetical protein BCO18430_03298 [Burkholderia contaminans]
MANIQVQAEHRLALLEEHRLWCKSLPRAPGQIVTAHTLVEGPPIYIAGEIRPYSDFDEVRFVSVDRDFVDYLRSRDFPFQEN